MNSFFIFLIIFLIIVLFLSRYAPKEGFIPYSGYFSYPWWKDWYQTLPDTQRSYRENRGLISETPRSYRENRGLISETPPACIIPATTNWSCVNDELRKNRTYNRAIISCTSPPSVDASCLKYY